MRNPTSPDPYLDALLGLPRPVAPMVSLDSKWVAWTWFGAGPGADVYVAPTDGSTAPTRLTETPEHTFAVSWTPDSTAVLVTQDQRGDERRQLFRVDLARPGVLVPLTEPSPSYFLYAGRLHPNGRWLIYAANFDAATGAVIEPTWLYRHDLRTGERRVLARPEKAGHVRPRLNEQGTHILYARSDLHPAGSQVWLVDIEGRDDHEILNLGPRVKVNGSWFPDGRRVLVLAEAGAHRRLGVWERETGNLRWVLDDPRRNLEAAFVPHDSTMAVVEEVTEARTFTSLLDVETGEEVVLPRLPGNLELLAPLEGGAWVASYAGSRQPSDLVRCVPQEARPESFTSLTRVWERTSLRPADLTAAEDFRWRSADGLAIQGWLYRAAAPARGAVVYVHGGPTSHEEDRLSAEIQYLVARGFHVLAPNYRGSTGFSLAFQEAIKEDGWGGREQDDIRAGVEALIAAGVAERGKVGITGTSYGGYSSWCAITRWPPELLAAAAPVCGMTDLVVDYQTTRPDLRPYSEEMLGGSPEQVPRRYHDRSPINFVQNIHGRLLIVQGLRDPNVTPENVRAVEAALQAAGVAYEVLVFADEGHGITRPENQRTLYRRLAAFFATAFAAPAGTNGAET